MSDEAASERRRWSWKSAAIALLILNTVLLLAVAYEWRLAVDEVLTRDSICRAAKTNFALSLGSLQATASDGQYDAYNAAYGTTMAYLDTIERCPQSPLEDHLYASLDRLLSFADLRTGGLWNNSTALGIFAQGLADIRSYLLLSEPQSASDRTDQVIEELRAMGLVIP